MPVGARNAGLWWRRHRADVAPQLHVAVAPGTPAPLVRVVLGDAGQSRQDGSPTATLSEGEMVCLSGGSGFEEAPGCGDLVTVVIASVLPA